MKRDRKRRRNPGARNDSNPGEPTIPAGPGQQPRTLDPTRRGAFCARSAAACGDVAAGSTLIAVKKAQGARSERRLGPGSTQPGRPQNRKKEKRKKKKKNKNKKKTGEQAARAARFGPIPLPPDDFTENPGLFRKRRALAPPQAPRRGRIERARPGASNKRGKGGERVERTGKIAPAGRAPRQRRCSARSSGRPRTVGDGKRETENGKQGRATADGCIPSRPETTQSGRGNKKRSGFHRSFSQAEPDRVPRMGRPGDARLNLLCKRFPLQQTSGPRHEAKARARP